MIENKKIRIGYIVSTLQNSGPVNILFNIIKEIDKKRIDVYIFTLKNEKKDTRVKEFLELGCEIINLNFQNINFLLRNLKKEEEKINSYKLNILHSHCFRSTLLLSYLKIKNIKKVTTIHSNVGVDYKINFGVIKGFILKKIYYKSLNKLDLNIACSKSIMPYYKKEINKLEYIQNGVDLEMYNFKQLETKKRLREKLKLEEDKIYFISVGSLCKRKDPFYITNQFKNIKNPNIRLIFLGDGEERNKISNIKDTRIILLGKVKNVNEYLKSSDYYISASKSEGLPNAVLEALAFKLPVLLSNIAPHCEILEENINAGILYDKNKKNSLKEAIENILLKDYNEISAAAYNIVENKFNSFNMSQNYVKEYKCVMKN
ncbi:glycosyltransferase family 4 protein [Cetobacterium ceti]